MSTKLKPTPKRRVNRRFTPATGSATRFTFMSDDGRYPVAANGKVQWVSDRDEAIREAKSWGFNILVEMDDQGHRLGMVNLKSPNKLMSDDRYPRHPICE